jgi:hypothetical protein
MFSMILLDQERSPCWMITVLTQKIIKPAHKIKVLGQQLHQQHQQHLFGLLRDLGIQTQAKLKKRLAHDGRWKLKQEKIKQQQMRQQQRQPHQHKWQLEQDLAQQIQPPQQQQQHHRQVKLK